MAKRKQSSQQSAVENDLEAIRAFKLKMSRIKHLKCPLCNRGWRAKRHGHAGEGCFSIKCLACEKDVRFVLFQDVNKPTIVIHPLKQPFDDLKPGPKGPRNFKAEDAIYFVSKEEIVCVEGEV